jgi:hypothetical protein
LRELSLRPLREPPLRPLRELPLRPLRELPLRPLRELSLRPLRELSLRPLRELPLRPLCENSLCALFAPFARNFIYIINHLHIVKIKIQKKIKKNCFFKIKHITFALLKK